MGCGGSKCSGNGYNGIGRSLQDPSPRWDIFTYISVAMCILALVLGIVLGYRYFEARSRRSRHELDALGKYYRMKEDLEEASLDL